MTKSDVRAILGEPTKISAPESYWVNGKTYGHGGQWTYQHPLRFGYVNVLWETNGAADYAHYEEF